MYFMVILISKILEFPKSVVILNIKVLGNDVWTLENWLQIFSSSKLQKLPANFRFG